MDELKKIKKLISRLDLYRDYYYNKNESIVSDMEYDALFDELNNLEKKTGIIFSNSPTQTVGYPSVSKLKKVKHNHPLLSLGKTTNIKDFAEYFNRRDCLVMAKLDGLTCSVLYKDGKLVRAESRGDGETGEDITHNAQMFSNLPLKIPFCGELVVDGECVITYDELDKINDRENTQYKNPRNLVSGTVRQLNSRVVKDRNVKFIAWKLYDMISDGIRQHTKSYAEGFQALKALGFDIVPCTLLKDGNQRDYEFIIADIKSECNNQGIPIDGVVGMFNDVEYGLSLGNTGHHPRHSLAFKFYQNDNETILTDIEWETSRTGMVNPVAIFEPVEIDGTIVTRATLNNVSIIKELKLGIGDRITVIKANQIIPQITRNLTKSDSYVFPEKCPSCGNKLVVESKNDREILRCTNRNCPAVVRDKISNFACRDAMNIVGISDERLRSLMDMGFITEFKSLYDLHDHKKEITKQRGWGETSVDALLVAIENSRNCRLQNLIVAIGIPGIGKSAAKSIATYIIGKNNGGQLNLYESFLFDALNKHDWTDIPGFGENMSESINEYVAENYDELAALIPIVRIIDDTTNSNSCKVLDGKTFCITGKLVTFNSRDDLIRDIELNGGIVMSGVTSKTNYLITNDKNFNSSKNKNAKRHGTKIISELEYIERQL